MVKNRQGRYDLHIKVPSESRPGTFHVVRRRVLDGGYECGCERWVQAREECRHVRPIREAMVSVPSAVNPLEKAILRVVDVFPYYIPKHEDLRARLIEAVRSFRV